MREVDADSAARRGLSNGGARRAEIGIVGVPMDLGAGRRGVDMGPFAIRYAGLAHDLEAMGMRVTDHQNIAVPGPEGRAVGNPRAKFDELIESACVELRERVAEIAAGGHL